MGFDTIEINLVFYILYRVLLNFIKNVVSEKKKLITKRGNLDQLSQHEFLSIKGLKNKNIIVQRTNFSY